MVTTISSAQSNALDRKVLSGRLDARFALDDLYYDHFCTIKVWRPADAWRKFSFVRSSSKCAIMDASLEAEVISVAWFG